MFSDRTAINGHEVKTPRRPPPPPDALLTSRRNFEAEKDSERKQKEEEEEVKRRRSMISTAETLRGWEAVILSILQLQGASSQFNKSLRERHTHTHTHTHTHAGFNALLPGFISHVF